MAVYRIMFNEQCYPNITTLSTSQRPETVQTYQRMRREFPTVTSSQIGEESRTGFLIIMKLSRPHSPNSTPEFWKLFHLFAASLDYSAVRRNKSTPRDRHDNSPDAQKHIDREPKAVSSQTGEVQLRWGKGLMTINAPKAQGSSGSSARTKR